MNKKKSKTDKPHRFRLILDVKVGIKDYSKKIAPLNFSIYGKTSAHL